ncbi:MAG: hypothetical protein KAS32_28245 [Candidatus Peribacteraceae bacterium]|nr:hypothetical protein [Candidatus Peribacteraceae bacterium]
MFGSKLTAGTARRLVECDLQDHKMQFVEKAIDNRQNVQNMPEKMRRNFMRSIAAAVMMDALNERNIERIGSDLHLDFVFSVISVELENIDIPVSDGDEFRYEKGHIYHIAEAQRIRMTKFIRDELDLLEDELPVPEIEEAVASVKLEFNQLRDVLWPSLVAK